MHSLKAQMAYKQVELQEKDAPKICESKLKINRPQISFKFFQKIDFGGWTLWRGGGWGSGKSVQRTLCVKQIDL